MKAVQAMTVMGAVCGAVACAAGVLMAVSSKQKRYRSGANKKLHDMMPRIAAGAAAVACEFKK